MSIWETPDEKKDEIIEKIFNLINRFDMMVPAVLVLETMKPLAWAGGALAHIFLSPFMLAFWSNGFSYIHTLQEPKNIEKLIKMIEDKHKRETKSQSDRSDKEKIP
ncbi:MAG: hypothetical protein PVJ38_02420 [Candidatus Bathyarchaeota archaeon]|jgi:hypothetical protein